MAMTKNEFHRGVIAYLQETYGVKQAAIIPGGKHSKCAFLYNDKKISFTIPNTPSDRNRLTAEKGNIRRLLGPEPDLTIPRQPRTLEAMTAEVQQAAASLPASGEVIRLPAQPSAPMPTVYEGSVALRSINGGNKSVTFNIPPEIYKEFARETGPQGCEVDFTAPDVWVIRHGRHKSPKIFRHGGSSVLAIGGAAALVYFGKPFRATTATYQMRGGRIEIHLTGAPRFRDAPEPAGDISATPATVVASEPVTPAPVPPSAPVDAARRLGYTEGATETDAQEALRIIRRVESLSPYRLQKVRGSDGIERWRWTAPRIELEDEE